MLGAAAQTGGRARLDQQRGGPAGGYLDTVGDQREQVQALRDGGGAGSSDRADLADDPGQPEGATRGLVHVVPDQIPAAGVGHQTPRLHIAGLPRAVGSLR